MAAIALISDEETLRYFPANLQQIKAFGDVGIKVYLITNCESDNPLLARAVVIANNLNMDLSVITIDVITFFPQYKSSSNRVPAISLMKLFLGELLPDEDLVLYLDIDTVICKSLSTLLNTPIFTPVAAVEELSTNRAYFPLQDLPEVYFNSGIMLLSLKSFRALGISKKAHEVLEDNDLSSALRSRFMDQDILNYLFSRNVTLLPRKYNQFSSNLAKPKISILLDDIAIVQFAGMEKPWNYPRKSEYTKLWVGYFTASLGSTADRKDLTIIKSRKGGLSPAKILVPLGLLLEKTLKIVRSRVPYWIKNLIRGI